MNLAEQKAALELQLKAAVDNPETDWKHVEDLTGQLTELNAKMDAFAKAKALLDASGPVEETTPQAAPEAKSLGEHYWAEIGREVAARKDSSFSLATTEFKAATDGHTRSENFPERMTTLDNEFVREVKRELTIADLFTPTTITGDTLKYWVQQPNFREGKNAFFVEDGALTQVHWKDFEPKTAELKNIGHFFEVSRLMVEDQQFMISEINNESLYGLRLDEEDALLLGDGTNDSLTGILHTSGIQELKNEAGQTYSNADLIYRCTTLLRNLRLRPTAMVMNPTDYEALRLAKDSDGHYFAGGFFANAFGEGFMQDPSPWGLNTVITPAIAEGTVLVGDFKSAGKIFRKGGISVESTNSHGSNFTQNQRITFRVQERLGLAIQRPAAIVKLTLGAAAS